MAGKKKNQDFTIHKMQTCPEGKVLYLVLEVNLMVFLQGGENVSGYSVPFIIEILGEKASCSCLNNHDC